MRCCRARESKKENFFHVKGYGIKIYPQTNIMFTSKMRREQLENKQMTYKIVKARELHLVFMLEINNHVYIWTHPKCASFMRCYLEFTFLFSPTICMLGKNIRLFWVKIKYLCIKLYILIHSISFLCTAAAAAESFRNKKTFFFHFLFPYSSYSRTYEIVLERRTTTIIK